MSVLSSFNQKTQHFLTFLGKFSGGLALVAMCIGIMFITHMVFRKPTPADDERIKFIKKYAALVLSIAAVLIVALTNVGMMIMTNSELAGVLGIFAFAKFLGL